MTTATGDHGLLFSPLDLRGRRLRNRIVFTAHTTSFGQDGVPGSRARAYYEARAAGDAGLIVMEPLPVHPTAGVTPQNYRVDHPGFVAGLREVALAVHAHGTVLVSQLYHLGQNADELATQRERWAPSAGPAPDGPGMLRAIDDADIAELVAGHVAAARAAMAAGADGVECMFAYDTLVDGFMSASRNRRTDRYGGPFDDRMRLARELLDALRAAIGPDAILGVTLSAALAEHRDAAAHLDERCDLDYVGVGNGSYAEPHLIIPPMDLPEGIGVPFAAAVKDRVARAAVIAEGRINRAEIAERALAGGACDLVGMTRALIADPDLPRKVADGRATEVRPCIGVNTCIARRVRKFPIACAQNPLAGREHERAPASAGRLRVVVIGAGPAGLECARALAAGGHGVTLLERERAVGGQLTAYAPLPGQAGWWDAVRWREAELGRLGVDVRLGDEATVDGVAALAPHAVVVATGSAPSALAGAHAAVDVLRGAELPDGPAVVLDEEGHRKAIVVAELLAGSGRAVALVPLGTNVGADLEAAFALPPALERLRDAGVRVLGPHRLERIEPGRVLLSREPDGEPVALDAAAVAHAGPHRACDELVPALRAAGFRAVAIGDARAPRLVADAIRDGHDEARRLGPADIAAPVAAAG
jgi:2,4-dienoyl-CoA reductase-like NADH-dependent reductase (Old Yellow Enzyme family)